jgi:branched-chain amino acid transport system substrate-binding protein
MSSTNKRRQFIAQSAAATSALALPLVGGAQPKPIKVGVLHPGNGCVGLFRFPMP